MNDQEVAARIRVLESVTQSILRSMPAGNQHEILTWMQFQWAQEPDEKLIAEQWKVILDPKDPERGNKLAALEDQLKRRF